MIDAQVQIPSNMQNDIQQYIDCQSKNWATHKGVGTSKISAELIK